MVDVHRILCPIDFSPSARHALEHALAIAKWYESEVTAMHVVSAAAIPYPPILFAPASVEPTRVQVQTAERELQTWLDSAAALGIRTDALVEEGGAASHIVERARTLPADLIVMGTHGLSGFERLMLGSITEKVLRKAPCPVLTVPPAASTAAKIPYTRILCPIDFSESSLAALRFAVSLAEEADAHLILLHVLAWPADDELLVEQFETVEVRELVERRARERLDALLTEEMRVWCKPVTRIAYGKAYREILATADADSTDLIVIGVRGRNALDVTLFGSTTNQVVRGASCPVLTLKQ